MASVDVFVPCYNYGRFLRDGVGSVLSQEGVEVRVLILDDCSTDHSADVGRALAAGDPRVEYRRHEKNLGHIATYNEGIDWLAGDYCLLLSADDLLVPGALARAAAVMDAHPEVGLTHGRAIWTDRPDLSTHHLETPPTVTVETGYEFVRGLCETATNTIETPTAIGRTSIQKATGYYRPELPHAGDLEMWLRFAARGSVARLDAHQAFYRTHGANMSCGYRDARDLRQVALVFRTFFRLEGSHFPNAAELADVALRQVVERIFDEAYHALIRGDDRLCAEHLRFASELDPRTRFARKWLLLRCKRFLGSRVWRLLRGRRNPPPQRTPALANSKAGL